MSNPQEFKNDKITVSVRREPGCQIKMEISANAEKAIENWTKALKSVKKQVSFPGYRKGKAPDQMVLKKYENQVQKEFRDQFLNDSAQEAMRLSSLYPWDREGSIKADIVSAEKQDGGKFTLAFESFPDVPEVNPASISIKKVEAKEIGDKEIEEHILSLRYHHATKEDAEGRDTVEHDDYVDVAVVMEDGSQPERKTTFHVNDSYLQDWLYSFLIGKKIGETATVTPPKPEKKDRLNEENIVEQLADPRPFLVTVNGIKKAKLEDMSDEFAKKYGSDTVEAFKKKVREYLEKQSKEEAKNQIQAEVQEQLTDLANFDLPASLFEKERQESLKNMIDRFKMAQYSDDEITAMKETLEKVADRHAKKALITHYILGKIAEQEKFEVGNEEVMQELIKQSMMHTGQIDPSLFENMDRYAGPIIRRLQLLKAMEYLSDRVSIK